MKHKYACCFPGCFSVILNVDDLPPEHVVAMCSPGWRWDGTQMWCPKHGRAH